MQLMQLGLGVQVRLIGYFWIQIYQTHGATTQQRIIKCRGVKISIVDHPFFPVHLLQDTAVNWICKTTVIFYRDQRHRR